MDGRIVDARSGGHCLSVLEVSCPCLGEPGLARRYGIGCRFSRASKQQAGLDRAFQRVIADDGGALLHRQWQGQVVPSGRSADLPRGLAPTDGPSNSVAQPIAALWPFPKQLRLVKALPVIWCTLSTSQPECACRSLQPRKRMHDRLKGPY